MHGEDFKGGPRNSATFKMELFATIGNGRNLQRAPSDGLTINKTVFASCCGNLTIFTDKIKNG